MDYHRLCESDYRFLSLIWEHEPVNSTELVRLCKERLGWSKATTYTVIKRLADRGVLSSEDAVVRSLVSREEAESAQIDEMVEKTFAGSLPAFVAAFTRGRKLGSDEVEALRRMIDGYEEE